GVVRAEIERAIGGTAQGIAQIERIALVLAAMIPLDDDLLGIGEFREYAGFHDLFEGGDRLVDLDLAGLQHLASDTDAALGGSGGRHGHEHGGILEMALVEPRELGLE